MENRLDRLFKNELAAHKASPSEQAWEKLHGQLRFKRRALWMKRLAVAASLALLVGISFIGYQTLINVETGEYNEIANVDGMTNPKMRPSAEHDEWREELSQIEAKPIVLPEHKSVEPAPTSSIEEVIEQISVAKFDKGPEAETKESASGEASESPASEVEIEENTEIVLAEMVPVETVAAGDEIEGKYRAEIDLDEDGSKAIEKVEKERSHPQVRIVYKANKDSELVTSTKSSIITKGIDKITEFSEEHVLTADRKSKLRNTKDDLLALNFGKLLNKSNRAIEN